MLVLSRSLYLVHFFMDNDFFRKLRTIGKGHIYEICKKTLPSLFVKAIAMVAALGVSLFLGRVLGVEKYGVVELAQRLAYFVLVFCLFGMENVLLKEISIAYESKRWQHVMDSLYTGLVYNGFISLVFIGFLLLFSEFICEDIFQMDGLLFPFRVILIGVVFQTLSRSFISGINAFGKIWQSNFFNKALGLVLSLLSFFFLFSIDLLTTNSASCSFALSQFIVLVVVSLYWLKVSPYHSEKKKFQRKFILPAKRLLLSSGTGIISASASVVVLGVLAGAKDVGLYNLASRLAMLTIVVLEVLNTVLAPKIAVLYSEKKIKEIQKLLTPISLLLLFFGVLLVVFFVFYGQSLVLLWGDDFRGAYFYLVILSIGQFVNLSTGAVGVVLTMTNNEQILSTIGLATMFFSILANIVLIYLYGVLGACIATLLVLCTENIVKVYIIKRRVGLNLLPILANFSSYFNSVKNS